MPKKGVSKKKGDVWIRFGSKERKFKWRLIKGVLRLYARGTPAERYICETDLSKKRQGIESLWSQLALRSQMDKDPWPMLRMAAVSHNSLQYLWDVIHSHDEWKNIGGSIRFDDPEHQNDCGGKF